MKKHSAIILATAIAAAGATAAAQQPAAPKPASGEPWPPMRFPLQPGSARSAAKLARGSKLPRSLDLLTNDVVFQQQKPRVLAADSVVTGACRDHSIK